MTSRHSSSCTTDISLRPRHQQKQHPRAAAETQRFSIRSSASPCDRCSAFFNPSFFLHPKLTRSQPGLHARLLRRLNPVSAGCCLVNKAPVKQNVCSICPVGPSMPLCCIHRCAEVYIVALSCVYIAVLCRCICTAVYRRDVCMSLCACIDAPVYSVDPSSTGQICSSSFLCPS